MLNARQTMCNASFMTIYSVASSLTAFSAWDVTPARKRCSWPSVASGGGFFPRVRAGLMAQTAAPLVECVIPWVPTRQWVVSVPIPLRYWMSSSQDLTAQVHTIIRTTIGQYYVNQAVTRGLPRANVHPGSVTFMQRFGSALQLQVFVSDY